MGSVVHLARSHPLPPQPEQDDDFIGGSYHRLSLSNPRFVSREGQVHLSRKIASAFCADRPLVAEAPTGTGKTIAYLIGGLAAARALNLPLVVATATKALQDQVMKKDLPMLAGAGVLQPSEYVIAKGRGNYFCPRQGELYVAGRDAAAQYDLFNTDSRTEADYVESVRELLEAYYGKAWNGDRDTWKTPVKGFWPRVEAARDICVSSRCEHFNQCPFFNARRALDGPRLIVTNHDMLLADLLMARQNEDLFGVSRYLLVVDEAHHLPEKAVEWGLAEASLSATAGLLKGLASFVKNAYRRPKVAALLNAKHIRAEWFDAAPLAAAVRQLEQRLADLTYHPDSGACRFRGGKPADELRALAEEAYKRVQVIADALEAVMNALRYSKLSDADPLTMLQTTEALYDATALAAPFTRLLNALKAFTEESRKVRWASKKTGEYWLHTKPLEGADELKTLLWNADSPRVRAVLVSATLKDFGTFERFVSKVGLPADHEEYALPHSFPYQECTLTLAAMRHSPRQAERKQYVEELKRKLPRYINQDEGTLILFSSWDLLRALEGVLRAAFGPRLLIQGEESFASLRRTHIQRIERGEGSILAGVATISEGLDLPGRECEHVIITAIPFAPPTDPVEEERAEMHGKEYFAKYMMPDALTRLIQMVGRLMRRETDRGRITIFDNRLRQAPYGSKFLGALPPFTIHKEPYTD